MRRHNTSLTNELFSLIQRAIIISLITLSQPLQHNEIGSDHLQNDPILNIHITFIGIPNVWYVAVYSILQYSFAFGDVYWDLHISVQHIFRYINDVNRVGSLIDEWICLTLNLTMTWPWIKFKVCENQWNRRLRILFLANWKKVIQNEISETEGFHGKAIKNFRKN